MFCIFALFGLALMKFCGLMNNTVMVFQLIKPSEATVTNAAAVSFLPRVKRHVFRQMSLLYKCFTANRAAQFLPRVADHVVCQMDLLYKSFGAKRATKWFLSRVNFHVSLQM